MSSSTVVDVSVIVPAYRAERFLERCLSGLWNQRFDGQFEVIVVASADRPDELLHLPQDPRLTVLGFVPRLPAATARNHGVARARARLLAFTDADVVVPPEWLSRLVAASGGRRCAAGSVINGTPGSIVGTVEYLVQFLDLHPSRPVRTAWHGATCNLLVPRPLWERHGPFPEDMGGGEDTLMTVTLRQEGAFAFVPDAWVSHLNRTRLREVLRHQFEFGRFTARLGRRSPYKLRPLVRYTALAPVAAVGRVVSLYARVAAWDRQELGSAVAAAPVVTAALASWSAGLFVEGLLLDGRGVREAMRRTLRQSAADVPQQPWISAALEHSPGRRCRVPSGPDG
ncbi:MAG: glycosyltransferase [Actinomycetota bacterium]|nr:glycosyltransferase [Actinomycetota bacterium]